LYKTHGKLNRISWSQVALFWRVSISLYREPTSLWRNCGSLRDYLYYAGGSWEYTGVCAKEVEAGVCTEGGHMKHFLW